jgi:hypothetical protein
MWIFMTCLAIVWRQLGYLSRKNISRSTDPISLFVVHILHDKYHIEAGQYGRLKVNVL